MRTRPTDLLQDSTKQRTARTEAHSTPHFTAGSQTAVGRRKHRPTPALIPIPRRPADAPHPARPHRCCYVAPRWPGARRRGPPRSPRLGRVGSVFRWRCGGSSTAAVPCSGFRCRWPCRRRCGWLRLRRCPLRSRGRGQRRRSEFPARCGGVVAAAGRRGALAHHRRPGQHQKTPPGRGWGRYVVSASNRKCRASFSRTAASSASR